MAERFKALTLKVKHYKCRGFKSHSLRLKKKNRLKYWFKKKYILDFWGDLIWFKKENNFFKKLFKKICFKKRWKVRYLGKFFARWFTGFYYSKKMPKWKRRILYKKNNIVILRTLSVFRTYYGDYSIKKFKHFIQRLKKRKLDFITKCLTLFESRLDILLYRLNYFKNPREARNFVRNKNLCINTKIKKELNYQLYINDIIEIKKKWKHFFYQKIFKKLKLKKIIYNFPKYLECNYMLFKNIFILYPKKNQIPTIFKFDWKFIRYLLLF